MFGNAGRTVRDLLTADQSLARPADPEWPAASRDSATITALGDNRSRYLIFRQISARSAIPRRGADQRRANTTNTLGISNGKQQGTGEAP